MSQIRVTTQAETQNLQSREVVEKLIDPEIQEFEKWFQAPERGNSPLMRLERDLLRSYLFFALTRQG